jgi:hypothetical protein
MPLLLPHHRAAVSASIQRTLSVSREPTGELTKAQLRAAVDAIDDWLDQSGPSLASALPAAVRAVLGTRVREQLLAAVCLRRAES